MAHMPVTTLFLQLADVHAGVRDIYTLHPKPGVHGCEGLAITAARWASTGTFGRKYSLPEYLGLWSSVLRLT